MLTYVRAAALASLWATAALGQEEDNKCVDGLHFIIARGTTEPQGPGDSGRVVERIIERIENSSYESVVYPATFTDPYHTQSIKNGSDAARKAIADYAEKCPDGKMALIGYSQGAQVMGNAICGDRPGWLNDTIIADEPVFQLLVGDQGDYLEFEDGPGVDQELISGKIVSLVLFGDPTFGANASFAEGTAESDGFWPRDWAACDHADSFTRSYCDDGDIICGASSEYVDGVHVQYLQSHGEDAVEFVLERWNEATGDNLEIDGGGPFPAFDEGSGGSGGSGGSNSSTPTPSSSEPTSSPSSSDTEETESTPTAAAAGLTAAGSLLVAGPLVAVAAWYLA